MTKCKRRSDRSGRASLRSPGRPPVAGRNELRRFWGAVASGLSSEDAATSANVAQAVGTRWFRKAGGMPPAMFGPSAKPQSGRYLSFAEREEIALLRAQGCTVQEVGRRIGRAASRSRGNCGVTPPLVVAVWSIARRQRNGTPSDQPGDQSRQS
jgi:Helix-turn-helix domain